MSIEVKFDISFSIRVEIKYESIDNQELVRSLRTILAHKLHSGACRPVKGLRQSADPVCPVSPLGINMKVPSAGGARGLEIDRF